MSRPKVAAHIVVHRNIFGWVKGAVVRIVVEFCDVDAIPGKLTEHVENFVHGGTATVTILKVHQKRQLP